MNVEKVVENIQRICKERGTTPTVAARESGAGQGMVTNMKKQSIIPSVEKMSLLAAYLGVTTSELLGEETSGKAVPPPPASPDLSADEIQVALAYRAADERAKQMVDLALEPWKKSNKFEKAM